MSPAHDPSHGSDLIGRLSSQQMAQSVTDCLTVFHQYIMSLVLEVGEWCPQLSQQNGCSFVRIKVVQVGGWWTLKRFPCHHIYKAPHQFVSSSDVITRYHLLQLHTSFLHNVLSYCGIFSVHVHTVTSCEWLWSERHQSPSISTQCPLSQGVIDGFHQFPAVTDSWSWHSLWLINNVRSSVIGTVFHLGSTEWQDILRCPVQILEVYAWCFCKIMDEDIQIMTNKGRLFSEMEA